jgi:GNAT superfamily N-acetyltransferase
MAILRDAMPDDAPEIATLIQDLAQSIGGASPITPAFVKMYLGFPGCGILLAEEDGQVAGLLSYSIRPNLYHNGDTALIEELIIMHPWLGQGLGSNLLEELFARKRPAALKCRYPCYQTIRAPSDFIALMDWWMKPSIWRSTFNIWGNNNC